MEGKKRLLTYAGLKALETFRMYKLSDELSLITPD